MLEACCWHPRLEQEQRGDTHPQFAYFSARYRSYVQDMERVVDGASDSSPKDLGYAPHRLDSTAKPFARCVLFCLAPIKTAQSILNERGPRSEVGADMVAFLVAFDVEFALTMAALADSGDEGLVVTRFFDVELFCKTLARKQLHRFMANMTYLFRHRGALNIEHSYFNYMVQVLEKHEIIIHVENKVRRVGGPGAVTADIFDRVFGRMAAWVDLALHIVRAEFPEFEVMSCFSMMTLTYETLPEHIDISVCCKRFTQTLLPGSLGILDKSGPVIAAVGSAAVAGGWWCWYLCPR